MGKQKPKQSWLKANSSDEKWAAAMGRCQHPGGHCGQDGYCHRDGDCFRTIQLWKSEYEDLKSRLQKIDNQYQTILSLLMHLRDKK